MKKIILDGKDVETLVPESLPMLIHGTEGSGASLYTICLAAKWFSLGYKIIFLCGYSAAEEAFAKEIGGEYQSVTFYTKEKIEGFIAALKNYDDKTIIIIKNIELFDESLLDKVNNIQNLIISGDVTQTKFKKTFTTEVYFSPQEGKIIPVLKKFNGFVKTEGYQGITTLIDSA